MKKTLIYLFVALMGVFVLKSCRMGLDELPVFEDAKLTNFWFEYREVITKQYQNGESYEVVEYTNLKSACTFSVTSENENSAECTVTINSGAVSKPISLNNIVGIATISTAATIEPLESSPALGVPGNFSSQVTYLVTAADNKTTKTYTITVVLQ